MNKLKATAAAILAFLAIAALFAGFNPTGFFALGEESGKEKTASGENSALNAGLSFAILQQTQIKAVILSKQPAKQCPAESTVEILLKNQGQTDAEKAFVEFSKGIKVLGCSNCIAEKLRPQQEIVAKAIICIEETPTQSIFAGSANSNKIEMQLE